MRSIPIRKLNLFEAKLVRLLDVLAGRMSISVANKIVNESESQPSCLSRSAVELIQQRLQRLTVERLACQGGWLQETFFQLDSLGNMQPRTGRVWERHPPDQLGLTFTATTVDFLSWLVSSEIRLNKFTQWQPQRPAITWSLGDQWLMVRIFQTLNDSEISKILRQQTPFQHAPLVLLYLASDWSRVAQELNDLNVESWTPWMKPPGSILLELLQGDLLQSWLSVERSKPRWTDTERFRAVGQLQNRILETFLLACEQKSRLDLAGFLLKLLSRVLTHEPEAMVPEQFWGKIDLHGLRLADREQIYQAALAPIRQIATLTRWQQRARATSYYEEDYAVQQHWLKLWEQVDGDQIQRRAHQALRLAQPFD